MAVVIGIVAGVWIMGLLMGYAFGRRKALLESTSFLSIAYIRTLVVCAV